MLSLFIFSYLLKERRKLLHEKIMLKKKIGTKFLCFIKQIISILGRYTCVNFKGVRDR